MSKILFALAPYSALGDAICQKDKITRGQLKVFRFPNNEMAVELSTSVAKQRCFIVGTTAPSDDNLLSLLMAAHTLKKEGAKNVTAILPYVGYARADKDQAGKSLGVACIGQLLKAVGIDRVVGVDVHSSRIKDVFPIPLVSLPIVPLFAEEIRKRFKGKVTIVAPDEGSLARCQAIRKAAGIETPVAYFKKNRQGQRITMSELNGAVEGDVIIIDDILDTGRTLVTCCKKLGQYKPKSVTVMVTHGLFTGDVWKKLWQQGVTKIYCTNTVHKKIASKKIERISVAPLLEKFLKA